MPPLRASPARLGLTASASTATSAPSALEDAAPCRVAACRPTCYSWTNRPPLTSSRSSGSSLPEVVPGRPFHDLARPRVMNRIVSRIAEIDEGEITAYTGNYDFYEQERNLPDANREAATRAAGEFAKQQRFIDRFSTHGQAAQVQSRVKAFFDKIERHRASRSRKVCASISAPPRSGDECDASLRHKAYGARVVHDNAAMLSRRRAWCDVRTGGSTDARSQDGRRCLAAGSADVKLVPTQPRLLSQQGPSSTLIPRSSTSSSSSSRTSSRVDRRSGLAASISGETWTKESVSSGGRGRSRLDHSLCIYDRRTFRVYEPTTTFASHKEMLVERCTVEARCSVSHDRTFLRAVEPCLELGAKRDETEHILPRLVRRVT